MMMDDEDNPRFKVDLVFRVKRRTKLVTVNNTLVCPEERIRGSKDRKKLTCAECRLCFERQDWLDSYNKRQQLPVVVNNPL